MYHSITIGEKNTWDNWHLIPSPRPVINPAPLNEKYVEVPGRSGAIDLTEAMTGSPTYGNRTGQWEFYVMHEYWPGGWADAYSTIMQYVHGKRFRVVMEDDPNYYYEGRISVNNWSSPKDYSKITLSYNLDPYKTNASTGGTRF